MTLHLTVNHVSHQIETATACESYVWHGETYAASGTYTYAYENADGCPSVDTLHLTIYPAELAEFAETVCEEYFWNNETFTASGNYTRTFTNANGCDSIVTLHLTVHHGTHHQQLGHLKKVDYLCNRGHLPKGTKLAFFGSCLLHRFFFKHHSDTFLNSGAGCW